MDKTMGQGGMRVGLQRGSCIMGGMIMGMGM
jgi:hypothetical protein